MTYRVLVNHLSPLGGKPKLQEEIIEADNVEIGEGGFAVFSRRVNGVQPGQILPPQVVRLIPPGLWFDVRLDGDARGRIQ